MASLDQMEGDAVELAFLALIVIVIVAVVLAYRGFQGATSPLALLMKWLQAAKDFFKNFYSGNSDDPGTNPVAQQAQGAMESGATLWDDFFGSNDSAEYSPADAVEMDNYIANYKIDPEKLQLAVLNAVPITQDWIDRVRSNPATLPMF